MLCSVGGSAAVVPMLLISMSAGYAVLALSSRQERPLNALGRFVGGVVLLVAFIGLLCFAACALRFRFFSCDKSASCPYASDDAAK